MTPLVSAELHSLLAVLDLAQKPPNSLVPFSEEGQDLYQTPLFLINNLTVSWPPITSSGRNYSSKACVYSP